MDVAIVGAGMAGLSAAWYMRRNGHRVVIFEKHYKPGGRMNSRRKAGLVVDHGERFLYSDHPVLRELILDCGLHSELRPLERPIYCLEPDGSYRQETPQEAIDSKRVVFPDGMLTLPGFLRRQVPGFNSIRVTSVEWDESERRFCLQTEPPLCREETMADMVLVACPAPEALEITQSIHPSLNPGFLEKMRLVEYTRCFTLMAAVPRFDPSEDFYGLEVNGAKGSPIGWIGFEDRKCEGRENDLYSTVVVHASPDASEKFFKMDEEQVLKILYAEARGFVPEIPEKWHWARAKHWEVARLKAPEMVVRHDAHPASDSLFIEFCGDYRWADGVEGAAQSGRTVAESLLERVQTAEAYRT